MRRFGLLFLVLLAACSAVEPTPARVGAQLPISQWPIPTSGSVNITAGDAFVGTRAGVSYKLVAGMGGNCTTDQWVNAINQQGVPSCTQPDLSQITGFLALDQIAGAYTDGKLLIGNGTTGELQAGNLTAGANVSVTNSAGGISVSVPGPLTVGGSENTILANNSGGNTTITSQARGSGNYAALSVDAATSGIAYILHEINGVEADRIFNDASNLYFSTGSSVRTALTISDSTQQATFSQPLTVSGLVTANAMQSNGTPFTISSGCGTTGAPVGGASAGTFTAGATSCNPVMALPAATNGWICGWKDLTNTADKIVQTAFTSNSCTGSGTVGSGDTILFNAEKAF